MITSDTPGVLRVIMLMILLAACAACAASPQDQCDVPVEERTGGWFCYEPAPSPSP